MGHQGGTRLQAQCTQVDLTTKHKNCFRITYQKNSNLFNIVLQKTLQWFAKPKFGVVCILRIGKHSFSISMWILYLQTSGLDTWQYWLESLQCSQSKMVLLMVLILLCILYLQRSNLGHRNRKRRNLSC